MYCVPKQYQKSTDIYHFIGNFGYLCWRLWSHILTSVLTQLKMNLCSLKNLALYNFSMSNAFSHIVNFFTLLDLFISSDPSICSTMASLHWKILISCCLSFHWLSVSLHNLWLLSCWLGQSSWSFERFSRWGHL